MRIEYDLLGEVCLNDDQYYGIHTKRAIGNFPLTGHPIHSELIKSLITIKKASAITNKEIGSLAPKIANAIISACDLILNGDLHNNFLVDRMQGGAGTSSNMNVNEVIANKAIEILGGQKGDYDIVHPLDHVNLHQSTNDVFPSAVRISAINLLSKVSESFAELQTVLQQKEQEFSDVLKVGRTQLQDAVPITLGQEFGAWAQAISRDRWRLYKSQERLRQLNIGGTAVGTGLNSEQKYMYIVIEKLREITDLNLARAEYLMDPTQNNDVFVEVSGLIKSAATNISKIANDLRLLASGPHAGLGEINLPTVQAGSSIMPGKVNPVIPEAINQIFFQIVGNDVTISLAAQAGQLELNPFMPIIAHNMLESLDLLQNGLKIFIDKCIKGISANRERCSQLVDQSLAALPVLISYVGYDNATKIAKLCVSQKKTIREIVKELKLVSDDKLDEILDPIKMTAFNSSTIR